MTTRRGGPPSLEQRVALLKKQIAENPELLTEGLQKSLDILNERLERRQLGKRNPRPKKAKDVAPPVAPKEEPTSQEKAAQEKMVAELKEQRRYLYNPEDTRFADSRPYALKESVSPGRKVHICWESTPGKFRADYVDVDRYLELEKMGLLMHQKQKEPRPSHYPDPKKIKRG